MKNIYSTFIFTIVINCWLFVDSFGLRKIISSKKHLSYVVPVSHNYENGHDFNEYYSESLENLMIKTSKNMTENDFMSVESAYSSLLASHKSQNIALFDKKYFESLRYFLVGLVLQERAESYGMENVHSLYETLSSSLNISKRITLPYYVICAEYYLMLKKYEQLDEIYQQCFYDAKSVYGDNGAPTLIIAKGLAETYMSKNQYDQAEAILIDTIEKMKNVLGPNNIITLATLNQLSNIYVENSRFQEAIDIKETCCLSLIEEVALAEPLTVRIMIELANLYAKLKMYDNADKLLKSALGAVTKQYGEYYDETITILGNLAKLYKLKDDYDTATDYYKKCVDILCNDNSRTYDTSPMWVKTTGETILQEAERAFYFWLNTRGLPENKNTENYLTLVTNRLTRLNKLADIHLHTESFRELEETFDELVEISQEALGVKNEVAIEYKKVLGKICTKLRHKFLKGEKLFNEVLDLELELNGLQNPKTIDTIDNMIINYIYQKEYKKAENLLIANYSTKKVVFGENDFTTIRSKLTLEDTQDLLNNENILG